MNDNLSPAPFSTSTSETNDAMQLPSIPSWVAGSVDWSMHAMQHHRIGPGVWAKRKVLSVYIFTKTHTHTTAAGLPPNPPATARS